MSIKDARAQLTSILKQATAGISQLGRIRMFGVLSSLFLLLGILMAMMPALNFFLYSFDFRLGGAFLILSGMLGLIAWFVIDSVSEHLPLLLEKNFASASERQRENPNAAKPAWDLATITLQAYFDRNIHQIRWIFALSVFVMLFGFGIVVFAIAVAIQSPEKATVAIIGGTSGVITQFLGATFVLVYRSTMAQASDYVKTLEKVNAVGMAMQILDVAAHEAGESGKEELRAARIDIAKLLLSSSTNSVKAPKLRKSKRSRGQSGEVKTESVA